MGRSPRSVTQLLVTPRIALLSVSSTLARLPIGMGAVMMVIFIHSRTGSFGIAGAGAAAFTLGFGAAGPLLGRIVDRRGARPVLIPASVLSSAALVAMVPVGDANAGPAALIALAALSGVTAPPVSGIIRRTWPSLVEVDETTSVYLLDAILTEVVFITGPLLTGILADTVGAAAAPLVAAGVGLVGNFWFLSSPVVGSLPRESADGDGGAGALASPAIRLLTFSGVAVGGTFGALDVALPAFGVIHGSAGLGGVYIAALGVGSIFGAFIYSAVRERLGDLRQATVRLAAIQPLLSMPLLFSPSAYLSIGLAVLAGSFAAPTFTVRNRVATLTMIPGTGTETFTLLLMSVMVGASGGSALAGPLVAIGGWRLGVIAAIAIPAFCLPVTIACRSRIPRG